MTHRSKWLITIFLIFSGIIPFSITHAFSKNSVANGGKLSMGTWQGLITRKDGHTIPFNFQISVSDGKFSIYVINGSERLLVDNIRQKGDSLFIEMPFFDSHFALKILDDQKLEGSWIKNYGDHQVAIPFRAFFNIKERYPDPGPPAFNISGRWSVHFKGVTDSTESVGEFTQTGSRVRGTFLTTTGDYRFLEGVVSGDTLKLSTFDGGHAYSFESRILSDKKMIEGFYYDGATSVETWIAEKNEQAKLPDEFSQTALKDSAITSLHFKFYDLNGHLVSVNDPKFKNKVVIVQILGSWCPNCMDETRFLSSYYNQNKSRGVVVLGLAYERTTSPRDARRLLQPFVTRFNVTYPILITGVAVSDSLRAEKTIPEIREIVGFPTTIFIDKKGSIRKIHTGFNGPGTGVHYEMYKKEFNELVNSLLAE
jgi:thiol-disulfide isomerase/thioredoxin